ncbi:hypothetical protein ACRYCC_19280 [Actinomadura scrupuli]|uniref:hypothetical protein n=1 Tax=Actinomadura scrupuli TaxID=559629 RepID=UPI003D976A19
MKRSRTLPLATVAAAAGLMLLTGCQDGPKAGAAGSTSATTASPGTDGPTPTVSAGPATGPAKTAYPPVQTPAPGVPGTPVPGAPGGVGVTPGTLPGGLPAKVFATPNEAAAYLVDAWRRGDRRAALLAAGPNTVSKVFAVRYVDTPIDECGPGAQSGSAHAYYCYHRYEGGSTGFDVDPYPVTGYRVVNFTRIAD